MSDIPSVPGSPMRSPMTPDRLRVLLDAYGARPERWPADEREAAVALLATSPEAAALRDAAARLDAALDLLPAPQPSAQLIAGVLAHAPGARRRQRVRTLRWRIAAAVVPLAAAAALVIWLWSGRHTTSGTPVQFAISDLGVYTMPTDVLLVPPGLDVLRGRPSVGCNDGDLGCPTFDAPTEHQSLLGEREKEYG